MHDGDAREAHQQLRLKLVLRQIAFDAPTLLAIRIEDDHARRPYGAEAFEPRWMLFDVRTEGHEMVVDELRDRSVAVRFGFQPNAAASGRSGAEIYKQRFSFIFGLI